MNASTKILLLTIALPSPLVGQGVLDQFSYEGLGFTGIGIEFGSVSSDRVTTELIGGARVDYGWIAPKVRLMFGATYFKGELDADEVARFENQLRAVVIDPTGDFRVDVGTISWSNFAADLDLQYVLADGSTFAPYAGLGLSVHVRNGSGQSINDTFVEDALDTIAAGLNFSAGTEAKLTSSLNLYADLQLSLTSELNMASLKGGIMYRPGASRGDR